MLCFNQHTANHHTAVLSFLHHPQWDGGENLGEKKGNNLWAEIKDCLRGQKTNGK